MKQFQIAKRLSDRQHLKLPENVATEKMAALGVTGSGKTYALTVIAEGMISLGIQTVILDPVGVWYGLRLAADGKAPGLSIPVFGGLHGDVPLNGESGAMLADVIVDRNISCVIDVSQIETDTERTRFATAFFARLYYRKKSSASPLHLILEECQEFVPEHPQRGEEKMLHEIKRIWKIGRNFGIGGTLASQRPQEVNKKVLNQSQTIFAFRLTASHEREAIEKWVEGFNLEQNLSHLPTGQCYVWSPFLQIREPELYGFLSKWTYDASSTPTASKARKALPLSPIDLKGLGAAIEASVAEAKANEPTALKARIKELEIAYAALEKKKAQVETVEKVIWPKKLQEEMEAFFDGQIAAFESAVRDFEAKLGTKLDHYLTNIPRPAPINLIGARIPAKNLIAANIPEVPVLSQTKTASGGVITELGKPLSKCAITLLRVLVQFHPNITSKGKLALVSGYSKNSSTFANGLSELRVQGMIVSRQGDNLAPTDVGIKNAGTFEPYPTHGAALDYWEGKVSKCAGSILRAIRNNLEASANTRVSRSAVADSSGYSLTSSTFANGLSELRVLDLIESDRDAVWLNPEFTQ